MTKIKSPNRSIGWPNRDSDIVSTIFNEEPSCPISGRPSKNMTIVLDCPISNKKCRKVRKDVLQKQRGKVRKSSRKEAS